MFWLVIPAWLSRFRTGGRVTRFGAGRVMSHTEIAAVFLPRAISVSAADAIGASRAASTAAVSSGTAMAFRLLSSRQVMPSGTSTSILFLPKKNNDFICLTLYLDVLK